MSRFLQVLLWLEIEFELFLIMLSVFYVNLNNMLDFFQ